MKKILPVVLQVGTKVLYRGVEHTLLGYHELRRSCVIEGPRGTHSGNCEEYWHDENGKKIPYVYGTNRYFVTLGAIKPATKEEPEFIFEI